MRLDRIELNLRRRSPWEAIDLGLAMVRRWCGPVYRVWLTSVLPVAIGILAALWAWPTAGMFVVWWLKPVADRVLLKVFSEATFGEPPSASAVWRSLPALLRGSGLLSRLTWRRFGPYRAFELPVLQLEGQHGKALRSRVRVLNRRTAGYALWLMFFCIHVVLIFEASLVQLIGLLAPGDAAANLSLYNVFFSDRDPAMMHLVNAVWLLAESVVEPFYVAAGFALYLNRRSELEGWDIEVAFRHMAVSRAGEHVPASPVRRRGAGLTAVVLVTAMLAFVPLPESFAGANAGMAPTGEVRRVAQEILSDPVFGREVEEMRWQYRNRKQEPESRDQPWWVRQLLSLVDWLAVGVRGVLYVLMAAGLAVLVVVLYRQWGNLPRAQRRGIRVPETLFGLDLRPASLPSDVAAAALAEADAGRVAAALSLLYRGALVALIERRGVAFRDGDTENACLNRVSGRVGVATHAYFAGLLDAWKRCAYAASPPTPSEVRALCGQWAEHFAPRGEAK